MKADRKAYARRGVSDKQASAFSEKLHSDSKGRPDVHTSGLIIIIRLLLLLLMMMITIIIASSVHTARVYFGDNVVTQALSYRLSFLVRQIIRKERN